MRIATICPCARRLLLAARARGRQGPCVPSPRRFGEGAVLAVATLAFLAACAGDAVPRPTGDAGSGGSAGTSPDAEEDATTETTDDPDASDDATPCAVEPDGTVSCPAELPPDDNCPDAAPSYTTEVAAIVERKCTVCHRPDGLEPAYQFDTHAKIIENHNNIHMLTQVFSCQMPKACGEPLTKDERYKLLQWLVCGAPNN